MDNQSYSKIVCGYETSVIKVGEEKILFLTIPYRGCTQTIKCLFCGVQECPNKTLIIDKKFGDEVFSQVKKYINAYSPDSIVLYNGGNILRPQEMFQETILEDIPKFIGGHPAIRVYELEVRADDVLRFREGLEKIQSNLAGKKLRLRLGIEFFDDELLRRHLKGLNTEQIKKAVNFLNQSGIEWNGYVLLGGIDMTRQEAREAAVKAGKFMIDNYAYKISINGIFVTQGLKPLMNRMYVPDYHDLIFVLDNLLEHKKIKNSHTLFKVGFEEEETKGVIRHPYLKNPRDLERISKKLEDFNSTQDIKALISVDD